MRAGWSRRAWLMGLLGPFAAPGAAGTPVGPPVHPDDDLPRLGRALRWPRDFGAHLGTRIEWWYVTGVLHAATAGQSPTTGPEDPLFGFQITFFRTRTAAADRPHEPAGRLAPRHLLFAHAALTDVRAGRLVHAERIARWSGEQAASPVSDPREPFTPWAHASRDDTDVRIGRWRLARGGAPQASTYQGVWQDGRAEFGLSLQLQATQPVLLQGEDGYSRKSPRPGHASGYYSQPQLRVDGRVSLRGQNQAVRGTAWLDHEWSNRLLDPQAVGWDWLGLNLDDGSALTVFQLRRADGTALWAGGSWRPPGRTVRSFEAHEVRMRPGRVWRSGATGAQYPVEWDLSTPAGHYTVRALVDAQELDNRNRTGTVYWEGLSALLDERGRRLGWGYLEMTGYAGRLQL